MKEKDRKRFLSKFKQGNPDECWEWEGSLRNGYGNFNLNGKIKASHRLSYIIFKGEFPDGLCVCHSCDNPACVNPNHLWLGSYKDNNLDCVKKGRRPDKRGKNGFWWGKHPNQGEKNPKVKLTEEQVREIRSSNLLQKEIGKIYNLNQTTISKIKLGKIWTHVK